jgi:hypothetical protein
MYVCWILNISEDPQFYFGFFMLDMVNDVIYVYYLCFKFIFEDSCQPRNSRVIRRICTVIPTPTQTHPGGRQWQQNPVNT